MDAIFRDEQFWQAVGYVLGAALAVVVIALAARWSSKWAAEAWFYIRQYEPQIKAAVDQPTDKIPQYVVKWTPWPDTPEQVSALATGLVSAVFSALKSQQPPQEVNVGGAGK